MLPSFFMAYIDLIAQQASDIGATYRYTGNPEASQGSAAGFTTVGTFNSVPGVFDGDGWRLGSHITYNASVGTSAPAAITGWVRLDPSAATVSSAAYIAAVNTDTGAGEFGSGIRVMVTSPGSPVPELLGLGGFRVLYGTDNYHFPINLADGVWRHFALVTSGPDVGLYVDGVKVIDLPDPGDTVTFNRFASYYNNTVNTNAYFSQDEYAFFVGAAPTAAMVADQATYTPPPTYRISDFDVTKVNVQSGRGSMATFNGEWNAETITSLTVNYRVKGASATTSYPYTLRVGDAMNQSVVGIDRSIRTTAYTSMSVSLTEEDLTALNDNYALYPHRVPRMQLFWGSHTGGCDTIIDSITMEVQAAEASYEHTVGPAEATAEALDATASIWKHASVTADPFAGGEAEMLNPTLNPDLGYTVTAYASSASGSNFSSVNNTYLITWTVNDNDSLDIFPPNLSASLLGPADTVRALYLNVHTTQVGSSGTSPMRISAWIDGVFTTVLDGTVVLGQNTFAIPTNATRIRVHKGTYPGGSSFRVSDPMHAAGKELTNFTIVAHADPGAYPTMTPATAAGESLGATVDTTTGVSIAAAYAAANGEMPRVVFPDWTQYVSPATAVFEMEEGWMKSDLRMHVDSMTVAGEVTDATVTFENNIIEAVSIADAEGIALDPDEVNQDMSDRYFDEIAKDNPWSWYRLNERSNESNRVYRHTPGGRVTTGPAWEITGQFKRGVVTGPGGRRAVDIDNAHLAIYEMGTFIPPVHRDPTFRTSSFEIVLRTTASEGVIAFGDWTRDAGYGSPRGEWGYLRLVDGRLEHSERDGVMFTSLGRVNDGKWHHIVFQHSNRGASADHTGRPSEFRPGLELWVDGVLDRTVIYKPNSGYAQDASGPRYDRLFSYGSGTPFDGDVMEFAVYNKRLDQDRVLAHYRGLMGYEPVMAPIVGAVVGASGDHKVESNMRRMLILNFQKTWGPHTSGTYGGKTKVFKPLSLDPKYKSVGAPEDNRGVIGWGEPGATDWLPNVLETMDVTDPEAFDDLGDIQVTYQRVEVANDLETVKQGWSAIGWDAEERGHKGINIPFTDTFTGERRFINLQEDIVDLDEYDIIYVQHYPNPTLRNQADRLKYEAFLDSLTQAIVDGHKVWISNPALAADLGLIGQYGYVPTSRTYMNFTTGNIHLRGSNLMARDYLDPRGQQVYPWKGKTEPTPIPDGLVTKAQIYQWMMDTEPFRPGYLLEYLKPRWTEADTWSNNRFRVVNEVEGLTDYPSFELESGAGADRSRSDFMTQYEADLAAYRYENRTGEDMPRGYAPSKGLGLKPGDEFFDYLMVQRHHNNINADSHDNYVYARNRDVWTFAVPPGQLRAGRAVTTFGSTIWSDNGKEEVNYFRDHITTAVVVPGDRIKGRLIGGYVFMQFSEHAHYATKDVSMPIDRNPWIEGDEWDGGEIRPGGMGDFNIPSPGSGPIPVSWGDGLTDYERSWQYASHRVMMTKAGGNAQASSPLRITSIVKADGSIGYRLTGGPSATELLPTAPQFASRYGYLSIPYTSWTKRGIRWLMNAAPQLVGAVNTLADASTAAGTMREPTTYSERDNIISVAPANAYGVLIPSTNVTGKDAQNFVPTATGTATIVDPGKTVSVKPMSVIAEMSSQTIVLIELGDINWLTMYNARELIQLRVEEYGASRASTMTIPGQAIEGGT